MATWTFSLPKWNALSSFLLKNYHVCAFCIYIILFPLFRRLITFSPVRGTFSSLRRPVGWALSAPLLQPSLPNIHSFSLKWLIYSLQCFKRTEYLSPIASCGRRVFIFYSLLLSFSLFPLWATFLDQALNWHKYPTNIISNIFITNHVHICYFSLFTHFV